jgi:hypothetical protein
MLVIIPADSSYWRKYRYATCPAAIWIGTTADRHHLLARLYAARCGLMNSTIWRLRRRHSRTNEAAVLLADEARPEICVVAIYDCDGATTLRRGAARAEILSADTSACFPLSFDGYVTAPVVNDAVGRRTDVPGTQRFSRASAARAMARLDVG